jgi:hypothetical protein
VAAHAVGDDVELHFLVDEKRILVVVPLPTDVGEPRRDHFHSGGTRGSGNQHALTIGERILGSKAANAQLFS